jgi:hypothetical protein
MYKEKLGMGLLYMYMASVMVFGLVYNWQYFVEHGFWAWFLFGEIIASFKAMVWPVVEGLHYFR